MLVGVPKEVKEQEYRVGIIPATVNVLVNQGHQVLVETGAGEGSYISDADYKAAGARIVPGAEEAWSADLVVKVKEPVPSEYGFLDRPRILFTYLHLASSETLTRRLLDSGLTAIAYETVTNKAGQLPLLMPMSEVAGRMAAQAGAAILQKNHGGRGVLMGGVPGVAPANAVILGGGTVGAHAARMAVGMGAQVTVLDVSHDRLAYFDDLYKGQVQTRKSNHHNIEDAISRADLVIGAVLIPGRKAPWLITRPMLAAMPRNAVIIDVAVDQGGCVETSKPTTHSQPTFEVDGIIHYCVANMPGAVPRTSTFALNNQTADYITMLANHGLNALARDAGLRAGLNTYRGQITHPGVAESFGLPHVEYSAV